MTIWWLFSPITNQSIFFTLLSKDSRCWTVYSVFIFLMPFSRMYKSEYICFGFKDKFSANDCIYVFSTMKYSKSRNIVEEKNANYYSKTMYTITIYILLLVFLFIFFFLYLCVAMASNKVEQNDGLFY